MVTCPGGEPISLMHCTSFTIGSSGTWTQSQGTGLRVKAYHDLVRETWSLATSLSKGSSQRQGHDERPPERVMQHYGAAPWSPSQLVSGAREPAYNLNWIIRLQAVSEIITNQTAAAPDLTADQSTQTRNAIFQHRVVLDYPQKKEEFAGKKMNPTVAYNLMTEK